jgi:hypothetical protein
LNLLADPPDAAVEYFPLVHNIMKSPLSIWSLTRRCCKYIRPPRIRWRCLRNMDLQEKRPLRRHVA